MSEEMNTSFARAFTREGVEKVLKQMGPLKSPGPNGFRAYFYRKYWNIVRDDVCDAVLAILHGEGPTWRGCDLFLSTLLLLL